MKLEVIEETSSLNVKNMTHKPKTPMMAKIGEDSQNGEARELLDKFNRWREESQRHLVNIIHSYNKSINEGFNDLVKEVSDLQAKVSVIKNETDDLPEEFDELGQQSFNMPLEVNLLEHEENQNHDTPRQIDPRSPILHTEEKDVVEPRTQKQIKALEHRFGNRISIHPKISDEKNHLYNGYIAYSTKRPRNQIPSSEEASLSHSIFKEMSNVDLYNINNAAVNEQDLRASYLAHKLQTLKKKQELSSRLKCEHCQYETLFRRDLNRHMKESHDKIRKFECERCPFTTPHKYVLKTHINGVHDKIRNHVCEVKDCGYAAKQSASLWKHMKFVHKMGEKKFKCDRCPYASYQSGNLKKHVESMHEKKIARIKNHICELCGFATSWSRCLKKHKESVHKQGGTKFKCEQCPFTSLRKEHVKRHVEGIHEKKKSHMCEECGHATSQKSDLKSHMASVHKIGDTIRCDQCSLEVYSQGKLNQHIKNVHSESPKTSPTRSRRGQKKKEEGEEEQPQQEEQPQEAEEQPQEVKKLPQEVKDQSQEVKEQLQDQAESDNMEMRELSERARDLARGLLNYATKENKTS